MTSWEAREEQEAARRLGPGWEGAAAAVVLGSGLGEEVPGFVACREEAYGRIPGLGEPTAPGHPGRLLRGTLAGWELLVFAGRRHVYEGISAAAAAFPVRLAAVLGARLLVTVSAVGGVHPGLPVGTWVFVEDHLNLMGRNPLEGVVTSRGPAFVDLTRVYRSDLYEEARRSLGRRGVNLGRGVLAAFSGPTYETPAEVRMAAGLGAAMVGMSTVPEAVWARFLGLDVVALGRVANPAAGRSPGPLVHAEVVQRSRAGGAELAAVLESVLAAWGGSGAEVASRPEA